MAQNGCRLFSALSESLFPVFPAFFATRSAPPFCLFGQKAVQMPEATHCVSAALDERRTDREPREVDDKVIIFILQSDEQCTAPRKSNDQIIEVGSLFLPLPFTEPVKLYNRPVHEWDWKVSEILYDHKLGFWYRAMN